jgi:Carboxypeptidase regulatory-like domain
MIAALLIALIAQQPQRDTRPAPAAATGRISGTISSADAQPRPLRRVLVTLNGSALTTPRSVVTSDDGSFVFDRVPVGRYTVSAVKGGYLSMDYGATRSGRPGLPVQVSADHPPTLAWRLPRGAVITGTVTDADGLPAQGIAVTALVNRYLGPAGERRRMAAGVSVGPTDDRGVYRIFGLPEGDYVIAAQAQTRQVGLPGAQVRTVSGGALSERSLVMSQVFHPGVTAVANATHVAVRTGEERSGIDVQLQYVPLATVSGSVSSTAGPNPVVIVMGRADEVPGFNPVLTARAAADGTYTFDRVPPGQYTLFAATANAYASADVAVNGDDLANVSMSFQPALTISGLIVFDGDRPAPDLPALLRLPVPVSLATANAARALPAVRIENGRFFIDGAFPGPYRLNGVIPGTRTPVGAWWLKSLVVNGRDLLDAPLDLRQNTDDAVVTFSDKASDVAGTVKDAQGSPAGGVFVVACTTDRAAWFVNSRRVVGVRADAQGRYSIRNLPPGEYRLVATTDLEPGEWFDPSTLERLLPAAGSITVTGVDKQAYDLVIRDRP